jgi:hypothetical protein
MVRDGQMGDIQILSSSGCQIPSPLTLPLSVYLPSFEFCCWLVNFKFPNSGNETPNSIRLFFRCFEGPNLQHIPITKIMQNTFVTLAAHYIAENLFDYVIKMFAMMISAKLCGWLVGVNRTVNFGFVTFLMMSWCVPRQESK